MSKYIIKNCPAWQPHEVHYCYNSGNTRTCPAYKDCILKQIVERCKLQTQGIGLSSKRLAAKILELFDIKEVE